MVDFGIGADNFQVQPKTEEAEDCPCLVNFILKLYLEGVQKSCYQNFT